MFTQAAEQAAGRLLASGEQHDTLREQLQEVVQRGEALLAQVCTRTPYYRPSHLDPCSLSPRSSLSRPEQVTKLQMEKDQLASTIKDSDKELKKAQQVQLNRFCSLQPTV
jgi:hypothetical protein